MNLFDLPELVRPHVLELMPVGSRRTCSPPPNDTDDDWLLLLDESPNLSNVHAAFDFGGWQLGGSLPTDSLSIKPDEQFHSYTKGDWNVIVTNNRTFFTRFMAATNVATLLNVMSKAERIGIFQAALYGRMPKRLADDGEL